MILDKITLFILIFTLLFFYKKYGAKIILHPVAYYLLMWIFSVVSFILFNAAGLDLIDNIQYLNELFLFISFTALSALFWSFRSKVQLKNLDVKLQLYIPERLFKAFVIFFFISSLITIAQSGFDVARNRDLVNNDVFNRVDANIGIIGLIGGVITMLSLPFTIYSGYKIGWSYIRKNKNIPYFYFLPLITTIITTISGGGRAGIVSSFLTFIIGFSFGFFSLRNYTGYKKAFKPLLKYVFVFFILFSLYSSYVSAQRSQYGNQGDESYYTTLLLRRYPYLGPVAGTFEYLVFHFQGYQYRRDDSTSDLEWGKNTFAFITQFNIPVISQLTGYNLSIANIFDIKYIDIVEQTLIAIDENKRGPSITATVYFILFKDFGFWGTLCAIFLFTGFTQKLYERLFKIRSKSFWSILLFLAIYKLWTVTIFSHHLYGSWFNSYLYPIFIIEIINNIIKNRTKLI